MTTALSNWDIVSDAELARAAAGGDRRAFAMIYDRYADRLHDFCVGMVRDRDAAADCVQDVFCTAASQLPKLREPDRLRPWLYAIARNEALRCIRDRRREQASDELPDAASQDAGPDTLAARSELADLIAQAAGGLSDRDRTVLELAYRHGLDGPELATALDVSPGTANRMVSRLRDTIETSLGALLVARRAQHTAERCPELAAILAGWDGHFSVLMRKRIGRHIESCPACEDERRRLVSPVALLGAAPILIPAPAWLRDQTLGQIQLCAADGALPSDADADTAAADVHSADTTALEAESDDAGQDGEAPQSRFRRVIPWVALFASVFFLSSMLTIALFYHRDTAITPTELSGKAPAPMKLPVAPAPAVAPAQNPPPPAAPSANTLAPQTIPPANAPAPIQAPAAPPVPAEPPMPPPIAPPPPVAPPPVIVLPPPVVIRPPTAPPTTSMPAPAPTTTVPPPPPRTTPKPPPSTPPPPPSSAPPPPVSSAPSHPPPATIYQRPR